jgi:hypothetical protein
MTDLSAGSSGAFGAYANGEPPQAASEATPTQERAALNDRVMAAKDWAAEKAGVAREWTAEKAGQVKDALSDERVTVISISAAAALAAGLALGFLIGRATAD